MQTFEHTEEGYKKWADDYYKSAQEIKQKIDALKEEKKTAPVEILPKLSHDIDIFYEMYYDCMDTYKILINRANKIRNKKNEN